MSTQRDTGMLRVWLLVAVLVASLIVLTTVLKPVPRPADHVIVQVIEGGRVVSTQVVPLR